MLVPPNITVSYVTTDDNCWDTNKDKLDAEIEEKDFNTTHTKKNYTKMDGPIFIVQLLTYINHQTRIPKSFI